MLKKMNNWMLETYLAKTKAVSQMIDRHLKNQRGAGAVEYGLVIAVVVVMVIAAASFMRTPLEGFFQDIIGFVRGIFGI